MKSFVRRFRLWFLLGVCLSLLFACNGDSLPKVDSFDSAEKVLQSNILPNIQVEDALVPDAIAAQYTTDQIAEPLPKPDDYPLYAAQPSTDPQTVYLEIYSSSEKGNAKLEDERWLVDVADAFNARKEKVGSGQVVQVGIRNIPSGLASQLLAAQAVKPAGFTPANDLWLKLLDSQKVKFQSIAPSLVPNHAGFVVDDKTYQGLASGGNVTFERLLDAILGGEMTIGYPNPYASSTALNLLYTIFWRAAGHHQDGKPLTAADLKLPQVTSVFDTFQKQVLVTTLTAPDLRDIFVRDRTKLQAFPLEYQNYVGLKKLPDFSQTVFVPFGVPHNSPLVGFEWNTPAQKEALKKFADFALSQPMQDLASTKGFEQASGQQQQELSSPPGDVLQAAQAFWKERKDGGRTVYMMVVIDSSGSMEGERLAAVQEGLRIATKQINAGNHVGLVSFGDRPRRLVNMAPFDEMQQKRILAAVDSVVADGSTAMYDASLIALSDLMAQKKNDPDGRYYLLLLTDGEVNAGHTFDQIKDVLKHSEVRIYPIAYGEVNQGELQAIASLRESNVQAGNPQNVEQLLRGLFQTNL
ncbi:MULTISPECIES: vWA domain-containing protein [unclassified Leptolyngbya]|uniref:vWA domain-containing protein n=1 Tax=unclassified Leptolyngbya TaxID=2650499 RepID=UPI0016822315|nr:MULTISPECIES: vWA domain-containing protein [unclassified Leptolyngbya]MBD1912935.1 VWA domain-containing protein [Leptolyngbya sp. FACHB-8]MBD2154736.1 VWA domain-containing protein [Leptolyngbya sp. FACHB-16]